jgi:hypothetical protein
MVRQEYEADGKIRDKAPTRILRRRLSHMCDCAGEFKEWKIMRVYKLTKGVESYKMNLFKEVAGE